MSIFSNKSEIKNSVNPFAGWGDKSKFNIDGYSITYIWEPSNAFGIALLKDIIIPWSYGYDAKMSSIKINIHPHEYWEHDCSCDDYLDRVMLELNIKLYYSTINRLGTICALKNEYYEQVRIPDNYSVDDIEDAMNHLLAYMKKYWEDSIDIIHNNTQRAPDLLKKAMQYEYIQ